MSDKIITADLMARLQRHYIKPGELLAGGMFLPEVTLGSRRADALYVGFFKSRGKWLTGHEVKASRADWLHELDQPEKAEVWNPECHSWYVVAPSTDIVRPEELPDGWGLMVPNSRTTTRMDVVVKAAHYPEREPSWEATHAIVQRADSLRIEAIAAARQKASESITAEVARRLDQMSAIAGPEREKARADRAEALLAEVGDILGFEIIDGLHSWDGKVALPDLRSSFTRWIAADLSIKENLNYRITALRQARESIQNAEDAIALLREGVAA